MQSSFTFLAHLFLQPFEMSSHRQVTRPVSRQLRPSGSQRILYTEPHTSLNLFLSISIIYSLNEQLLRLSYSSSGDMERQMCHANSTHGSRTLVLCKAKMQTPCFAFLGPSIVLLSRPGREAGRTGSRNQPILLIMTCDTT